MPPATAALPPLQAQTTQWRLGLNDTTQLVLEHRPWRATDPAADPAALPARIIVGLEFRAVDTAQGVRGWLLVQLPGSSVLQFRPRSGGLAVNYRLQF